MLPRANSYKELRRAFRWDVPARCNIAVDCCDRHVDAGAGDRVALIDPDGGCGARRWTLLTLKRQSNPPAHVLSPNGPDCRAPPRTLSRPTGGARACHTPPPKHPRTAH